jgi:DNA (cytosine-5)-methyltransferase 1
MKYLSVCSGIEAASVAFEPLGWKPLAFSEIEAFPRAVLQHHYPDTPLYGDFTELKNMDFIVDADILCGGTPCQSFSLAGKRESLDDDRGNLTLQFVLLADAIDNLRRAAGREPAFVLWENVPGVLSTKDNAFGAFLGGLCGRDEPIPKPQDGWPSAGVVDGPTRVVAWRVLDAQHFGLAQRRKRVFVCAFGGPRKWAAADALLPIIESSRWHPAPSREAGKGVASTLRTRAPGSGGQGTDFEQVVSHTLMARSGAELCAPDIQTYIPLCAKDPCHTLRLADPPMLVRMREGKEGGGKGPLVSSDQSLTLATSNDQVLAVPFRETADALTAAYGTKWNGNASADNGSLFVQATPINTQLGLRGADTSNSSREGVGIGNEGDPSFTLQANHSHAVAHGMMVRRLTPIECARLMGFPDDYLDITYRGKPAADGPKYRAVGNSWAVPVVRWIGEQINNLINR